jgi:cytochrome P450
MAKETKSFTFRLNLPILGTPMVVAVGDFETQRAILLHRETERPLDLYKTFNNITGGIPTMFTSNGEYWHVRRKLIAPAFEKSHVKRMNDVAMAKIEMWVETKIRPMADKGEAFDVGNEMLQVMLSSICETAFEYPLTEEDHSSYVHDLGLCLREFLFKSNTNPLRPMFGYLLPERRKAHQAAARLMGFAKKIMDHYLTLKNPVKGTIIDRLMTSDVFSNEQALQAEIVFLILAGHDTTGFSISWTLLELARNPKHIQDIRRSLVSLPSDECEKSEPLRNVVKEAMRLHPVAAGGSMRVTGIDMETNEGFLLPKGSFVFLPLILLLRNPRVYNNPDQFLPERWQEADQAMTDSFLPFSLGKQNCVGQALAKIELHSVVARICSEFDLSVVQECETEFFLTLKPIGAKLLARRAIPLS